MRTGKWTPSIVTPSLRSLGIWQDSHVDHQPKTKLPGRPPISNPWARKFSSWTDNVLRVRKTNIPPLRKPQTRQSSKWVERQQGIYKQYPKHLGHTVPSMSTFLTQSMSTSQCQFHLGNSQLCLLTQSHAYAASKLSVAHWSLYQALSCAQLLWEVNERDQVKCLLKSLVLCSVNTRPYLALGFLGVGKQRRNLSSLSHNTCWQTNRNPGLQINLGILQRHRK